MNGHGGGPPHTNGVSPHRRPYPEDDDRDRFVAYDDRVELRDDFHLDGGGKRYSKTLDAKHLRSRRHHGHGHGQQGVPNSSLEGPSAFSTHSLERGALSRRRQLPDVPSKSLPRPAKRGAAAATAVRDQSASRSRERPVPVSGHASRVVTSVSLMSSESSSVEKRSHSHGDELEVCTV